jgi:hypothetical protein
MLQEEQREFLEKVASAGNKPILARAAARVQVVGALEKPEDQFPELERETDAEEGHGGSPAWQWWAGYCRFTSIPAGLLTVAAPPVIHQRLLAFCARSTVRHELTKENDRWRAMTKARVGRQCIKGVESLETDPEKHDLGSSIFVLSKPSGQVRVEA